MSIRKVSFVSGEHYHVYNRGNSKQRIFHDAEDYNHFMGLLFACNQKDNFKIDNLRKGESLFDVYKNSSIVNTGAYVLMPNHFHILLMQDNEGSISKFMQKLSTAYVMYYNRKYKRSGGLFEGKFKSQHLGTDRQLKYVFSYIHLNVVKLIDRDWREKGIRDKNKAIVHLKKYTYSSFSDYLGVKRIQNQILNIKSFPRYFPNKKLFITEIIDWLDYNEPLR